MVIKSELWKIIIKASIEKNGLGKELKTGMDMD
jgi:hypothetical protein